MPESPQTRRHEFDAFVFIVPNLGTMPIRTENDTRPGGVRVEATGEVMKLASRGLLVLWMLSALWSGMLAAYFLHLQTALLVARQGMGSRGAGLVALWTLRVIGVVAIWLGAGRATRWWPELSRRRLALSALGGILGGALLGYLLDPVVGDGEGNLIVAVTLLGYAVGILLASSRQPNAQTMQ